jgi:hypothetical protein
MANYQCLEIPELITRIFRELRYCVPTKSSYFTMLARLARTTTRFTDPALDLLWHSQTSLAPLVCSLPADAIATETRGGKKYVVSILILGRKDSYAD